VLDKLRSPACISAKIFNFNARNERGALNSWNDVEEVHTYWAYQVSYRLCELRGMTLDCIPPEKAKKK